MIKLSLIQPLFIYIYICVCVCVYIPIYIYIYLFINLFHVGIFKTSQKCDEAQVEQWIKKILKDAPDREGGSCKITKKDKQRCRDFIIIK